MVERTHGIASKTTKEANMRRLVPYILKNDLSEFIVCQLNNGSVHDDLIVRIRL